MTKEKREGYQAFWLDDDNCPYLPNTKESLDWWEGWQEGSIDKRSGR